MNDSKGIRILGGMGCALGALFAFAAWSDDRRDIVFPCVGGVFALIAAALFVSAFRAKKRLPCPKCGGVDSSVRRAKGLAFQFSGDRACSACGTVWRQGVSKGGGVASIIVGAVVFLYFGYAVIFIGLANIGHDDSAIVSTLFFGAFAIGGGSAVAFGFRVLTGSAGKLEIISEGSLPSNAQGKNA
jgi:hypothetical protein